MKTTFRIITAFVAAAVMTSCLDLAPKDNFVAENFYKNEQQTTEALYGVYSTLASTNLYGGCILGRLGLSADIGYEDYASDEATVGYYAVVPQDTKITNYWKECYAGIGNANKFLENIDKPQDIDPALREQYRGEVLFLRAYYYFMLTKRFGDVPLILSTPKSVSLEELQVERTPQKEVYEQILKDMAIAAELVLPASELENKGGGRINQSTVYGIMARVALNMAGYPVNDIDKYAFARECCEKVINLNFHALNPDFTQVFKNYMQKKYDIKESIWEVEFYGNNVGTYTTTAGQVGRNNGIKMSQSWPGADSVGVSIGTVRATPYYLELFAEGDLRRGWTIADYVYNTTGKSTTDSHKWDRFCGKFRREYETLAPKNPTYTETNFPLLRYSDVLLMYAEAVACGGGDDLDKAYEYMNMVRRRGFGKDINTPDPEVDRANTGAEDLMAYLIDERAFELGHEFLRKDDVTRWNIFMQQMRVCKALIDVIPKTYTSSYYASARACYNTASEKDMLWPIPSYDIAVNRKLTQNPGW